MAQIYEYEFNEEVTTIMNKIVKKFGSIFEEFVPEKISVIFTLNKKKSSPMRLISVSYPSYAFIKKPYIIEVFKESWDKLSPNQKNLWVFRTMLGVSPGGFDEQKKTLGKKRRHDYNLYEEEMLVGGASVASCMWMADETQATDILSIDSSKLVRKAVKRSDVESL